MWPDTRPTLQSRGSTRRGSMLFAEATTRLESSALALRAQPRAVSTSSCPRSSLPQPVRFSDRSTTLFNSQAPRPLESDGVTVAQRSPGLCADLTCRITVNPLAQESVGLRAVTRNAQVATD